MLRADPRPALVDAGLVAPHPRVVAALPGCRRRFGGAVVGREQDQGLVANLQPVQSGQQAAEVFVNVPAHSIDSRKPVVQPLDPERIKEAVWYLGRGMGGIEGDIAKERLGPVPLDEGIPQFRRKRFRPL